LDFFNIKTLFRINGLNLCLPYKLRRYTVTKDRAPTTEEIERLIDIADIRGKLIIAMLAQGGFRIGTLAKLQYRHVREDLERNIIPVHIHVEAKITKGKYHDYDTFLGQEAVHYLKAYLRARKAGGMPNKIPPETFQDDTPLIRNEHAKGVKAVTPGQLYNILHRYMAQAGLLGSKHGRRYKIRPHSIRKFFRTQLSALGLQADYVEYMMGHTISTYHDIEMKGIEFLRAEYAKVGLSLKPKTETNKMAIVREFLKSMGLNPEEILSKEAQAMPHRTVITHNDLSEQDQVNLMLRALMQKIKQEIITETQATNQKTV
jgi:integrase